MIQVSSEVISEKKTTELQKWLSRPECDNLIILIESEMKGCMAKASNHAIETGDHPQFTVKADEQLNKAAELKVFVEKMRELQRSTTFKRYNIR